MAETVGDRVRELRVARGMSQGDLARGLVSGSYISLIEAGKRMPEREVTQVLADRLGTTAEFLLTGVDPIDTREEQLALRYAEIALANGQVAEALGRFKNISLNGRTFHHDAAWGLARAYEAQGLLQEALKQIEWLLAETRAGRATVPGLMVLLMTQCRIYREGGDFTHAIEVGEKGLEEVRGLGLAGTEDEVRLASTIVGCYWQRGDWLRAEVLAQDVIQRAEAQGSHRSRGSAYWNASLVAESQGKLTLAIELAERSLALFAEGDDDRSIALLRMNLGFFMFRRSPLEVDKARKELEKAREVLSGAGLEIELAYCDTALARLLIIDGHPDKARDLAQQAVSRLRDGSAMEVIQLHLVLAQAFHQLEEADTARHHAELARDMLLRSGSGRKVAVIWRDLSTVLELLGDGAGALAACKAMADCAGIVGTAMVPETSTSLAGTRRRR